MNKSVTFEGITFYLEENTEAFPFSYFSIIGNWSLGRHSINTVLPQHLKRYKSASLPETLVMDVLVSVADLHQARFALMPISVPHTPEQEVVSMKKTNKLRTQKEFSVAELSNDKVVCGNDFMIGDHQYNSNLTITHQLMVEILEDLVALGEELVYTGKFGGIEYNRIVRRFTRDSESSVHVAVEIAEMRNLIQQLSGPKTGNGNCWIDTTTHICANIALDNLTSTTHRLIQKLTMINNKIFEENKHR